MQPIPISPTGVQVVQTDAETLELENLWVRSSIGLKGEARPNWELPMSHNIVCFFSHREYNATGKWTLTLATWSSINAANETSNCFPLSPEVKESCGVVR